MATVESALLESCACVLFFLSPLSISHLNTLKTRPF